MMLSALNRALRHAIPPETCSSIGPFTMTLDFKGTLKPLYIECSGQCFTVSPLPENAVSDFTLSGTPFSLWRLAKAAFRESSPPNFRYYNVYLHGSIDQALHIVSQLKPLPEFDLADTLAPYIGDTLALGISEGLQRGKKFFKRVVKQQSDNAKDYCQYEADLIPPAHEVQTFIQQLQDTTHQADRLHAKLHHLLKTL